MYQFQQFTQQDIEILEDETVYRGFFKLNKVKFKHKLFAGGWSGVVTRELLIKGAASAVVAYDPNSNQSPWLLELIAGMVEEGETPESVALRESEEEAGAKITHLQHCLSVWDSPGGVLERIHLFVGKVDSTQVGGLHGLAEENEDIRVHVVSRETAYQWVCEGKIDNGIAVMGLQWLALNYPQLKTQWR